MKKTFKLCIAAFVAAFALSSCEDVPAPYNPPTADEGGTGGNTEVIDPIGTGTATDPFNVAAILKIVEALDETQQTDVYYVKGYVTSLNSNNESAIQQYGNITYNISDTREGANKIMIFQSLYLDKQEYTSVDQLKIGDEVVVCAKWVNYKGNTPETAGKGTAYLYSLNGKASEGTPDTPVTPEGTATGDGTAANPYNSVAALNLIATLEADVNSDSVYVKGKVMSISELSTSYGNATYTIADDKESATLLIYRGYGLNGDKFTSTSDLEVGDEVVVKGCLVNFYGNTPEMTKGSKLISNIKAEPRSEEGGDDDNGEVNENSISFTAKSLGVSNGVAVPEITLADGTVLTFDAGGNQNGPKYYDNGSNVRMYPKNTMTITSSKKIASVTLNVDTYNGTICNASGDVTTSAGTIAFEGNDIKVSGADATSLTLTNTSATTGAPSQIRWVSAVITYAE